MSETPFRVVPCPGWPDIRNVVAPDGTKFADGLPPIGAKAVADNLNSAWSAAGGPALTRQRDELRDAVRHTLEVFHDKCRDYDDPSWNPDAHIEVTLTIADLRRLAAAIGGG